MFDLPELTTLARQMNEVLPGRVVRDAVLGNRPHRFVWYNRTPDEFRELTRGRTVGTARAHGKWLFLALEPGYVLTLGDFGGRVLYHAPGAPEPTAHHLLLRFDDGSSLSAMTQMWGFIELHVAGEELERPYVQAMRTTPDSDAFTQRYFDELVDEAATAKSRSVKSLLVQDQLIPGLGNAIAQDIMFAAHLDPRHRVADLSADQRHALYRAVRETVRLATDAGGRADEVDLFGRPGGYARVMDSSAVGQPCRRCGAPIQKIQYLGGACYLCPSCQN